jgi:hypothetical protein
MVSIMHRAVSGLTKHEAPSAAVASSGNSRAASARRVRYWPYISPPRMATVLPTRGWAAGLSPAATTTPAPSLPTGMASPIRPAMARIPCVGTSATVTSPSTRAVDMSAAPTSRPRSDGLIGVAWIRTTISSGPGAATGTSTNDSSSRPSAVIRDRSCSPVAGRDWVMEAPDGVGKPCALQRQAASSLGMTSPTVGRLALRVSRMSRPFTISSQWAQAILGFNVWPQVLWTRSMPLSASP